MNINDDIILRQKELERSIQDLLVFMHSCIRRKDWHGVRDAAADIEKLECELSGIQLVLKNV